MFYFKSWIINWKIKNLLTTFKFNDLKTNIKYDDLSRVIQKNIYLNNILLSQDDYEYLQLEDNALDLIKEHTFKLNNKILSITDYTYDISKTISSISYNNELIKYQYDTLNRLIKEVTPSYTKEYKYDNGGNIISIKEASNNILFEYSSNGWKDQLISIKDNNQETIINYDESGRMINIGSNNLSWNLYNQLTKFNEISFEYNMNGLRTSKTSPSKLHKYHYLDKLLIKETINELEIKYEYSLDNIIGFVYNNTRYIYQKNILKAVLKIIIND